MDTMPNFPGTVAVFAEIDAPRRDEFESLLAASAHSSVSWLNTLLVRLLRRPAKRLRPALVLAAADCGPRPDKAAALACAAAVELVHQSSVVHDDLMDEAGFRGAEPALHVVDGPAAAVLAGDFLVAAGGRAALGVSAEAAMVLQQAFLAMCDGQARETANQYRVVTVAEYLSTVRGKTAALIRASCQLGGLCGGLDPRPTAALAGFGEAFGMLYQIVDDLMDVVSTPDLWGKPVEHDVRRGVYTLPVLIAARDPALAALLGPDASDAGLRAVYEAARSHAVVPTVNAVLDWAARARVALDRLPPSAARDDLGALPLMYATAVLTGRVADRHQDVIAPLIPAGR
jgi:heptaprenyl diphosphate synthase